MSKRFPGLHQPTGRASYRFAIAVPKDLWPQYGGRKTIMRGLGTDRRIAEIKAADLHAIYTREFAVKRGEQMPMAKGFLQDLHGLLGEHGTPILSELLPVYLEGRKGEFGGKRAQTIARAFTLAQSVMGDLQIGKVTRADVRGFVDRLSQTMKSPLSVKLYVVAMQGAFQWAADNGMAPEQAPNPFLRQVKRRKGNTVEAAAVVEREPFTGPELQRLLRPSSIRTHILVAAFAGLRVSEIVSCSIESVEGVRCFAIREGKTKAARRYVPVHPKLRKITESDLKYSSSNAISSAFHTWRKECGIDDPTKVFHSLRHGWVTALSRSDCEPDLAAYLAGHSRQRSWTYRTYGHGKGLKSAAAAVAKVRYPGLKL